MYSTCLFCHAGLGRNEAIEPFPVGRRLAFDGARGRLWIVCRACERWNLTPVEERWEAIDECERHFRATKLRVCTDNIGLARLPEGLELVRVGSPLRPEMAAWRYGDQFGRRRRRRLLALGGAAAAGGAVLVGLPLVATAIGVSPLIPLAIGSRFFERKLLKNDPSKDAHVVLGSGQEVHIEGADIALAQLLPDGDDARLLVVASDWSRRVRNDVVHTRQRRTHEVRGDDIARVVSALLPQINARGGSPRQVAHAVRALDEAASVEQLYRQVAAGAKRHYDAKLMPMHEEGALANIPAPLRLALEMAAHEEQERRALEGELAELERAWEAAEEIARIADGMFVPPDVTTKLDSLKGAQAE